MNMGEGQHELSRWVPIARRPLTERERGWVTEILNVNKLWADVTVGDLFAVGKCGCGCGTVVLERPPEPQNPRMAGKWGPVGFIYIFTRNRGLVTVMLYHDKGYLSILEAVYDDYEKDFQPLPETWEEAQRTVESG